jgi:hypothetical protein
VPGKPLSRCPCHYAPTVAETFDAFDVGALLVAVDELTAHVDSMLPRLTSREDLVPRQYAAACLARCNRLLGGMAVLLQSDHDDVAGLAVRPILECWYLTVYLVFAPDEALAVIQGANAHQVKQFDASWDIPTRVAYLALHEPRRMDWRSTAQRVGELLIANTSQVRRWPRDRTSLSIGRNQLSASTAALASSSVTSTSTGHISEF